VVLQGPTIDRYARNAWKQLVLWAIDGTQEPWSQALIGLIAYYRCGLPRVLQTFQEALNDRPEDRLPFVQAPALVVRGSRDPIVSQEWAEEVVGLLPKGRLLVVPGGTHTINYLMPLELARITRAFLRR
jgi:2-hydroxy-6-oxonona-2,4-dienedioate hydrolase